MLGKILSAPIRIVNAPLRAMEKLATDDHPDDRIASAPLNALAEAIEEIDDDD